MSKLSGTDGTVASDRSDEEPTGGPRTATPAGDDRVGGAVPATADAGDSIEVAADDSAPAGERRRTALIVAAITAVLAVPIVIAAVAVRTPPWYPLVDLAQIEMRVRDVGTAHPPLVGLGGRIFGLNTQGSHPGPISFYLLAPVYRLLGATPWALQVSAATLNIAALAGTVWAAHRRRGVQGALLVAAGLALLMRIEGTVVLLYPWNPYMPVLFWALFLVCVWGVLCDDLPLLPVAVLAGSVCAQTHIPYMGLVGGLGAVVVAGLVVSYRRSRGDAAARRLRRWTAAGLGLGVVLWLPVFIEQVGGDPGNVSVIVDSFLHPTDQPVGAASAWRLLTQHLDVERLLQGDRSQAGSQAGGIALLVAWAVAAVGAVRMRDRSLVRLHIVVAAALVLGFVTISRIFGATWFYLTLWTYGTAVLALGAVVATAAVAGAAALARQPGDRAERFPRAPLAALGLAVVVPTLLLSRAAPDTEDADADVSTQLGEVVGPTVAAIEDGTVPGDGDGTYLITWIDPVNLGGQGLGLMLELERRGYDARATEATELSVREHRIAQPAETDAEIHVATGLPAIEAARARAGGREIAYHDPRSDDQVALYGALRATVIDGLTRAGLDALVPQVDGNIFGLAADERLPSEVQTPLYMMGNLPQPVAVFTREPAP